MSVLINYFAGRGADGGGEKPAAFIIMPARVAAADNERFTAEIPTPKFGITEFGMKSE